MVEKALAKDAWAGGTPLESFLKHDTDFSSNPATCKVNPLELQRCQPARLYFKSQRPLHVPGQMFYFQPGSPAGIDDDLLAKYIVTEAIDVYTTTEHKGMLNVSQNIDRMTSSREHVVPCITPSAQLWSMQKSRLVTGWFPTWFNFFSLFLDSLNSVNSNVCARHGKNDVHGLPRTQVVVGTSDRKGQTSVSSKITPSWDANASQCRSFTNWLATCKPQWRGNHIAILHLIPSSTWC